MRHNRAVGGLRRHAARVCVLAVSLWGAAGCAMDGAEPFDAPGAESQRHEAFGDAVGNYNFKVEIDGVTAGYFKSVKGLSTDHELVQFQDGDDYFLRSEPLRSVTFTNGYIVTSDLQDWWKACRDGQYDRRDISIHLNDNAGEAQRTVHAVWPKQWKLGGFDGKGNDVITEELHFVKE